MARREQIQLTEQQMLENDLEAVRRSTVFAQTAKYQNLDKDYHIPEGRYVLEPMPWKDMPAMPHPTHESQEYKASGDRLSVRARRVAHRIGQSAVAQGMKGAYERAMKGRDADDDDQSFDLWKNGAQRDPDAKRVDEINAARAATTEVIDPESDAVSEAERTGAILVSRLENVMADINDSDVPTLAQVLAARDMAGDLVEQNDGTFQDRDGNPVNPNLAEAVIRSGNLDVQRQIALTLQGRSETINKASTYESLPAAEKFYASTFINNQAEGVSSEEAYGQYQAYTADRSARYNQLVDGMDAYINGPQAEAETDAAADAEQAKSSQLEITAGPATQPAEAPQKKDTAEIVTDPDEIARAAKLRGILAVTPDSAIARPVAIRNEADREDEFAGAK